MDNNYKIVKGNKADKVAKSGDAELEKSKLHIIVEIIEYVSNSVVIKTIIKKSPGNISVMSFDSGEGLTEKSSPFDTFAQIIEGKAEIEPSRRAKNGSGKNVLLSHRSSDVPSD